MTDSISTNDIGTIHIPQDFNLTIHISDDKNIIITKDDIEFYGFKDSDEAAMAFINSIAINFPLWKEEIKKEK